MKSWQKHHPLRRWLRQQRLSVAKFAARIGMTRAGLYRMFSSGTCLPEAAARIELATGHTVRVLELLYANRDRWADFWKRQRTQPQFLVERAASPDLRDVVW